jgi:hypothetical protein
LKLALRGAVIVVAGTLLALMSSAAGLEALKFTAASIITFRVLALLIFGGLVYLGLVKPMRRRVTDSQVALYLEECDPSLQAAILSAVESSALPAEADDRGPSPSWSNDSWNRRSSDAARSTTASRSNARACVASS